MTRKERFLKAFKQEKPDRVACLEQTVYASVASQILGRQAFTGGPR